MAANEHRVDCPAELDLSSGRGLEEAVKRQAPAKGDTVLLDFAGTSRMDAQGGAWLIHIADSLRKRDVELRWTGMQGDVADFMDLLAPGLTAPPAPPPSAPGFFDAFISGAANAWDEAKGMFDLCVEALYWTVVAPLEGQGFRWNLWFNEVHEMGVRAIRIVCLMNFLLGLIIAMLSAAQVAQFGIGIYVADLIMIAFARELAAIMTAVVVSARTGAAIAAELATMKVQEEIDALRSLGLHVGQYLVAPKMLALLVVMPCLIVAGMLCGIVGGSIWGIFVLEISPTMWFTQTLNAATVSDMVQGLLKGFFFAVTIVIVGCHNGLRVSGGSRGVGLMTTRAVVMDIFMLIVIDIVFAGIFYYALPTY